MTDEPPFDLVVILWADAHCGASGWLDLDEFEDDGEALVYTAGFLVPEGQPGSKKGHVTVWQSWSDGEGIHPFHIPSTMVRTTTVVWPGRPLPLGEVIADG